LISTSHELQAGKAPGKGQKRFADRGVFYATF
jgi:hypothetical protein